MHSNDKKVTFMGFGVLFVMLVLAVIFGSNASGDGDGNGGPPDDPFEGFTLYSERVSAGSDLAVGASEVTDVDGTGKLIKNITATVTWTDESEPPGRPRIRPYTNQPDTFSVVLSDVSGNHTGSESGSNQQGEEGRIMVHISIEDRVLWNLTEEEYQGEMWTVDVTMEEAGMWAPRFGMIGLTDQGNDYSLIVEYDYYDLAEIRGE